MSNPGLTIQSEFISKHYDLLLVALQASTSGIIITDNLQPDNPILFVNNAFEQMSGYKYNEIVGRNCRFLQGKDREQGGRYLLANAVKKGESCTVEMRNYRKNGTEFWNELYMSPIKNEDGTVTHFIGIQNDITRRKIAESNLLVEREQWERNLKDHAKQIEESQHYLRSIIETLKENILVLDKEMKVISANAFFYSTFAMLPEDVRGKYLYDIGNGAWNVPELKYLLENVLRENKPFEGFEITNTFKDIGIKHLVMNAWCIQIEGTYKNRIILTLHDVTENKENDKRKDDFLSIASHELRSPVNNMKGYMQLAEMYLEKNDIQQAVETLKMGYNYINKLNSLINDLLDITRIKAGKTGLNKSVFDFDDMVKYCAKNLQVGVTTHTIYVQANTDTSFSGDREKIEQVITNLVQNAVKYSPKSDSVYVSASLVSGFVKVSVKDTGVGIDDSEYKKIFQRFYRVKETQKDFIGIGIGLYICDNIIKEHNGNMWVDSEKGKGSVFSFTLPLYNN